MTQGTKCEECYTDSYEEVWIFSMQMDYTIRREHSAFRTTEKRIVDKHCHRNTQGATSYGELYINTVTSR
jgi:hypothetical protein